MKTADAARGKWRGILMACGASAKALVNRHGPCPFCGGHDRFRWDNQDGNGSFFCSQCGSGDGFEFLRRMKGWDFKTAAVEIDQIVGNIPREARNAPPVRDNRKLLNELWLAGSKVTMGDPAGRYLAMRGLDMPQNTDCLRFVEQCPVPNESGSRWAMVAMVMDADGKPATLHRTFLGPNGKADIAQPRALMPGSVPDGAAIRLSMHGERLGIAEGIETALAATRRFGLPVWAAINSTMMTKWKPPEGVREVVVFGDNDQKFGGAAAAYALAHRLSAREGLSVEVRIPAQTGLDWADAEAA